MSKPLGGPFEVLWYHVTMYYTLYCGVHGTVLYCTDIHVYVHVLFNIQVLLPLVCVGGVDNYCNRFVSVYYQIPYEQWNFNQCTCIHMYSIHVRQCF